FRSMYPQGCGGSSPFFGTNFPVASRQTANDSRFGGDPSAPDARDSHPSTPKPRVPGTPGSAAPRPGPRSYVDRNLPVAALQTASELHSGSNPQPVLLRWV